MQVTRTFTRAYGTNSTESSADTFALTADRPQRGTGVVSCEHQHKSQLYEWMDLVFFGTDGDNETMNYKLIGWRPEGDGEGDLWVPFNLLTGAATFGSLQGPSSGAAITDSDFIADTITSTSGLADDADNRQILSPTDDTPGMLQVRTLGFPRITIDLWRGTAASVNALYSFHSDSNRVA